ncbi:MAG: hypothetical protein WC309_02655 [Candidatus Paceibacterota bacterium]|jgi:hypothetical protein|nr:hypothetical protein [Candidatus Omnitrophota bacterium]
MKKVNNIPKQATETKTCVCKQPEFAFKTPSMKTDGTYFQYCKKCQKFRDVPKPKQGRELIF